MPAHEVLTERASKSGKLVGAISSGGLSTRPSRKAYEELKSPYDEPRKPSASPLSPMREDAEVFHTCLRLDYFYCHITPNTLSEAHLKRLVSGPQLTSPYKSSACVHDGCSIEQACYHTGEQMRALMPASLAP